MQCVLLSINYFAGPGQTAVNKALMAPDLTELSLPKDTDV